MFNTRDRGERSRRTGLRSSPERTLPATILATIPPSDVVCIILRQTLARMHPRAFNRDAH